MIFTAFVYLASFILGLIVGILPTSTGFPSEVQSAFDTMAGYVQILNTLLPIGTLATVLTLLVATDIIIFGFKTLKWLFSYIPFIGGRE
jgi:hypothetical protein